MATITLNIPPADAADALAALTPIWKNDAARLFFGGDVTAFSAATNIQQLSALIKASVVVPTKNYRQSQAQAALPPATEPSVT